MDDWRGLQAGGQVHVEGPVRDGWWVYGRYMMHSGELKLVEVRVFPGVDRPGSSGSTDDDDRPGPSMLDAGTWSESLRTLDRMPPPQSISARLLRAVDFSRMAQTAKETTGQAQITAEWLAVVAPDTPYTRRLVADLRSTHSTAPGKAPDVELAKWAHRFATISATSASPMRDLAEELGKDRGLVKLYIDAARAKRYLTSPGQGRRRSDLTAEAIEVLRRNGLLPTAENPEVDR